MAIECGDRVEVQTSKMMYPEIVTIELIIDDQYFAWLHDTYMSFSKKDVTNYIGKSKQYA